LNNDSLLQDAKTAIYVKIVTEVASARPGVLEMMDAVPAHTLAKTQWGSSFLLPTRAYPLKTARAPIVNVGF